MKFADRRSRNRRKGKHWFRFLLFFKKKKGFDTSSRALAFMVSNEMVVICLWTPNIWNPDCQFYALPLASWIHTAERDLGLAALTYPHFLNRIVVRIQVGGRTICTFRSFLEEGVKWIEKWTLVWFIKDSLWQRQAVPEKLFSKIPRISLTEVHLYTGNDPSR